MRPPPEDRIDSRVTSALSLRLKTWVSATSDARLVRLARRSCLLWTWACVCVVCMVECA